MGEEPERAEAVGDGDDHGALRGQPMAVVVRLEGPTASVAAAVEKHQDRQPLAATFTRRPDIEVQAILADGEIREHGAARTETLGHTPVPIEDAGALHASRGEVRRGAFAVATDECHRRSPSQFARRWFGERHAKVGIHPRRG